jgi:hypothetical protein
LAGRKARREHMEGRGERRTKGGKVIKDGCEGSGGEWTERIAYDQRNTEGKKIKRLYEWSEWDWFLTLTRPHATRTYFGSDKVSLLFFSC